MKKVNSVTISTPYRSESPLLAQNSLLHPGTESGCKTVQKGSETGLKTWNSSPKIPGSRGGVPDQKLPRSDDPWIEVVGVSGDVVHQWFSERGEPTVYRPYDQVPQSSMMMAVQAAGAPAAPVVATKVGTKQAVPAPRDGTTLQGVGGRYKIVPTWNVKHEP